jgi:UDP-N-acetylmuramoylalanine--D-glutamate ligase
MDHYRELKYRLFQRMAGDDLCLVHEDECDEIKAAGRGRGEWRSFGTAPGADYRFVGGWVERIGHPRLDIRGTYFDNPVVGPAAAAAIAAVEYAGVEPVQAAHLLASFHPLPHRLQTVHTSGGVRFIDDSKATSLTAMMAGIRMARGPVRLIAGGTAKETDFTIATDLLADRTARVYLVGRDSAAMYAAWHGPVDCVQAGTLERAMRLAVADAVDGDQVLLSPGCASFDQFANYAERGNRFTQLARSLCRPVPPQESDAKAMDNTTASVTIRNPVFT